MEKQEIVNSIECAKAALETIIDMLDDIAEDMKACDASRRIQIIEFAIKGIIENNMVLEKQ